MKKSLLALFAFVFLATPIVAQITKLEPLTAHGCGNSYSLKDTQDLKKVFGPRWKLLFKVNPELEKRILFGGSVLQKLYRNDTLCIPNGLQIKKEQIPEDAVTPDSIRPDQIFTSETKTSVPVTTPIQTPTALGVTIETKETDENVYFFFIVLGLIVNMAIISGLIFGNYRRTRKRREEIGKHDDNDPFSVHIH